MTAAGLAVGTRACVAGGATRSVLRAAGGISRDAVGCAAASASVRSGCNGLAGGIATDVSVCGRASCGRAKSGPAARATVAVPGAIAAGSAEVISVRGTGGMGAVGRAFRRGKAGVTSPAATQASALRVASAFSAASGALVLSCSPASAARKPAASGAASAGARWPKARMCKP